MSQVPDIPAAPKRSIKINERYFWILLVSILIGLNIYSLQGSHVNSASSVKSAKAQNFLLDKLNSTGPAIWSKVLPNQLWGVGADAEYDANGCQVIDFANFQVERAATVNGVGNIGSHTWVITSIFMQKAGHVFLLNASNNYVPCLHNAGLVLGSPGLGN